MAVNGITNYNISDQYTANTTGTQKDTESVKKEETSSSKVTSNTTDTGVIYEKSEESVTKTNSVLIAQLKADQEARSEQLRNIVLETISKQGTSFAIASDDDMWKFLASGNFTVDAATKRKAQEDISEDGYWGVKATSDRIIDFAKALSGNDASKIDILRDAFEKGFKQATKTWGKELPSISQDTYDAVMEKFDAWAKEANTPTTEETEDETIEA